MSSYSFLSSAFSSSLVKRLFSPIYTYIKEHESQRKHLEIYHKAQLRLIRRKKKRSFTLESAVSKILSPVVDMATTQRERAQAKCEARSELLGLDRK